VQKDRKKYFFIWLQKEKKIKKLFFLIISEKSRIFANEFERQKFANKAHKGV